MNTLLEVGLSNAIIAAALAVLAAVAGRLARRPALAHALWLLVLVKLITPPLVRVPILPAEQGTGTTQSAPHAPEVAPSTDVAADLLPPTLESEATPPVERVAGASEPIDEGTLPSTSEHSPIPSPLVGEGRVGGSDVPPAAAPRHIPLTSPWRPILATLWLCGSAAWLLLAVWRIARFGRALRLAEPAPADFTGRVAELAAEIGLRRAPCVRIVGGVVAPLVAGLGGRAVLIVPRDLWARLEAEQRDALLLHELAHLLRGDPWVRLVELLATALYWWHPVLWWARRGLHEAEEQCCDAWVVWARPDAARGYATALVEAVEFLSESPPRAVPIVASGLGRLRHVSRRITMIMKGNEQRRMTWLGLAAVLGLAILALPWLPARARPQATGAAPTTPAQAERPAPPLDQGDALQRAEDELELLESQAAIKKAKVQKAEAQRQVAAAAHAHLRRRADRVVSSDEVNKAAAELNTADADVAIAQAELAEAELRIKQARRRLEALRARAPAAGAAPVAPPPTQASLGQLAQAQRDAVLREQRQAVQAAEAAAQARAAEDRKRADDREAQAIKSLRQATLALHNYAMQHDERFPPPSSRGPDGKPLLSWRVAILPFLEQEALYQQFRLDEPWDSPHNKALIEKMPEVFRSEGANPGTTRLRAIVADGAIFDPGKPEGVSLAEITDGTSNTIALVEANEPIIWSQPEEGPGLYFKDSALVAFADGYVRRIAARNPDLLRALITRAGGEAIDREQFERLTVAGDATRRAQSINNLKLIGLGLHNYLDRNGTFPPAAIGRDGQPLLSWRVAILPYIEQEKLYEQFHLDEPWDSPHNKELLKLMPPTFAKPGGPHDRKSGLTHYRAVTGSRGAKTFWDFPSGTPISEIIDGTSNTIAVVEASEAVPWTKPEPIPLGGMGDPDSELSRFLREGFLALIADGSVRSIKTDDPQVFKALFTPAGGEVIDWSRISAQAVMTGPESTGSFSTMLGRLGGAPAAREARALAEAQRRIADLEVRLDQLMRENARLRAEREGRDAEPRR
jgi:beta-lactamase regulating signal transducer with metallopeptidase domain